MPRLPTFYIYHLKCEKNEKTGEYLFSLTCKGGTYHFDCINDEGNFFFECTKTQKSMMSNYKRPILKQKKQWHWFKDTFGVYIKPFYTLEEIGFRQEKIAKYARTDATQKIYFEKTPDDQFRYTNSMEPTKYYANVCFQEIWDLECCFNDSVTGHIFDHAYTAFWWINYFGITIFENSSEKPEKKSRKRGPRGELANLLDSVIAETPKKIRTQ